MVKTQTGQVGYWTERLGAKLKLSAIQQEMVIRPLVRRLVDECSCQFIQAMYRVKCSSCLALEEAAGDD